MIRRVYLSRSAWIATIITLLATGGLAVCNYFMGGIALAAVPAALCVAICLVGLFYMPMTVAVKNGQLAVYRPLAVKVIPLNMIASAEPARLKSYLRIYASDGFMGYWGWFKVKGVGKCFAYVGDRDDCFLIRLKDGRSYFIGCRDAASMAKYITTLI